MAGIVDLFQNAERDDDHDWGYQLRLVNTPLYSAKLLVFENDIAGGYHTHGENKHETFIILEGRVAVNLGGKMLILSPGDILEIPYNTWHSTCAVDGSAVVLEVSTHDEDAFTYYE